MVFVYNNFRAWGIENKAALEFRNEEPIATIGEGKVWLLDGTDGTTVRKTEWKADQA